VAAKLVDAVNNRSGNEGQSYKRLPLVRLFVEQGIALGRRPELIGGGLIRSLGGWSAVRLMRRVRDHVKSGERVLGDSDLVQPVLSALDERLETRCLLQSQGHDFRHACQCR
jgi:hypothetical protein